MFGEWLTELSYLVFIAMHNLIETKCDDFMHDKTFFTYSSGTVRTSPKRREVYKI